MLMQLRMKLASSCFSLNLSMRDWNSITLKLCLVEGCAVILELQMLKLSPEVEVDKLCDGRDCSVDGDELPRMHGGSIEDQVCCGSLMMEMSARMSLMKQL